MFVCNSCGKNVGPGVSQKKIVVEARDKVYDTGYNGRETVEEWACCQKCADKIQEEFAKLQEWEATFAQMKGGERVC